MQLGMMNDPRLDPAGEMRWAREHGFDFLDLTFEAPCGTPGGIDRGALRTAWHDTGLGVIGHTAWYLPFGSPVALLRAAAIDETAMCFDLLADLGATLCNVHASYPQGSSLLAFDDVVRWNAECFAVLAERASPYGITVVVEHPPGAPLNTPNAMAAMLAGDARLGFHLDIAHAHIGGSDKTAAYLSALGDRLRHVHVSDNKLQADDHLPLGVGFIDWPAAVRRLHAARYDGTVTLEVFAPDRDYLLASAAKWRAWWAGAR
jgi:sugar phosphate isomerase/epimerase